MGNCLSCKNVQELQPGKVHLKKLREIFAAYLKNQGIKVQSRNSGKDIIDQEVVENVERHAKSQAKDLIQLMQIDQQFILKISTALCQRIVDFDQSTEMQFLALVLLREVMQTPLNDQEKKKKNTDRAKKSFKQIGHQVRKLNTTIKGLKSKGERSGSAPPSHSEQNNLPQEAHHIDLGLVLSAHQNQQNQKTNNRGKKGQIQNQSPVSRQERVSRSEHAAEYQTNTIVNLQDLQSKEFVFCVQNETKILASLNELICYYNYDLNQGTGAVIATRVGQQQHSGNVFQKEVNQNRHFFAQVCLDMLNTMIDNIQKTQLVENEETYFDMISNYLFRSERGNVYSLFGLDPNHPYARGLEPAINPQRDGNLGVSSKSLAQKIPIQFNYNYLHNTSQQNLNSKDGGRVQSEADSNVAVYSNHIRQQGYEALFKFIKIMREQYFIATFPQILEHIWCLVKRSRDRIEQLGSEDKPNENTPPNQGESKKDEAKELMILGRDEHFESLLQMGFDIFQYICVKISYDSIMDQEEQKNLLVHGVFQYFNKKQDWANYKFAEFIFVLMIFNGGKTRMDGNIDFTDFYAILQKYQDSKQKYNYMGSTEMHRNQLSNPLDILDETMFDKIVENLFRILMDDLFVEKESKPQITSSPGDIKKSTPQDKKTIFDAFHGSEKFLTSKINLMKVLFEMLSLVESKSDLPQNDLSNFDQLNENPIYAKLVKESSFYILIFTDLIKFLSAQPLDSTSELSLDKSISLKEQFFQHTVQLFELYLFKTQNNQQILVKALDFLMCRIQAINQDLLTRVKEYGGNDELNKEVNQMWMQLHIEIRYLTVFSQVALYFIQENVRQNLEQSQNSEIIGQYSSSQVGISSSLKKRIQFKGQRANLKGISQIHGHSGGHHNAQSSQVLPNFNKLRSEYQIYLIQLCQTTSSESLSTPNTFGPILSTIKDEIVINALNIDLQIKDINRMIKAYQKQNSARRGGAESGQNTLNHAYLDLMSGNFANLHSKPVMFYKLKYIQYFAERDETETFLARTSEEIDFVGQDQSMQILFSQNQDLKHKDFLKIYLFSVKQFVVENLLKGHIGGVGLASPGLSKIDETSKIENSCMILLLENWLQLVQAAPQNRPDVGPLHFISFLITLFEELDDPKNEFASAVKIPDVASQLRSSGKSPTNANQGAGGRQPRQLLELKVKIKALFIYMLFGLIIEKTNQHQHLLLTQRSEVQSVQNFEFSQLRSLLIQTQRKLEKSSQFSLVQKFIPQILEQPDTAAFLSVQKNESSRQGSMLSDKNRHKKQKSSLISDSDFQIEEANKNIPENIDSISQKFDGLLSMDMRVIDQVIGNDLYNMLSQDKTKIKETAQNDLKECKANMPNQIKFLSDDNVNELSIDKAIKEMFCHDLSDSRSLVAPQNMMSKINLLSFGFLKVQEGNYDVDNIPLQVSESKQNENEYGHPQSKKISQMINKPHIDLMRKFDIRNFDNSHLKQSEISFDLLAESQVDPRIPQQSNVSMSDFDIKELQQQKMPESVEDSPDGKPRMINGKPINSRKRSLNNSVFEYGGNGSSNIKIAPTSGGYAQSILNLESCSSLNSSQVIDKNLAQGKSNYY